MLEFSVDVGAVVSLIVAWVCVNFANEAARYRKDYSVVFWGLCAVASISAAAVQVFG